MKQDRNKPAHPGKTLLKEVLIPHHLNVSEAAHYLGVTRPNLSRIVNGKSAVSPLMAIRIAKVFGGSPEYWVNLQASYDLYIATRKSARLNLPRFHATTP